MLNDAKLIIQKAIDAVLPEATVKTALEEYALTTPCHLIAIGKAAWRMANAAYEALGKLVLDGVVITKYQHSQGPIGNLAIFEAGHPVPDENSVLAANAALKLTKNLTEKDVVLFLVSGGGSALFECPPEGVTLTDIATVTKQLLACGADITEMNAIRKHLSRVKGGRFALHLAPARVKSIVLSDVLGDSLDAIASGPAYPDASTCGDVTAIIEKHQLTFPENVLAALKEETPKALFNVETKITGNVTALCDAAGRAAKDLGYTPLTLTTTLDCEAREAGAFLSAIARELRASGRPVRPPCAIILGGETVVHLRGKGLGGRNQELTVSAIKGLSELKDTVLFSIGSDGTDGPTDAAGGVVAGNTMKRCTEMGLNVDATLSNNDAYHLLKALDGLIITGPTGTNVNDLTMLLVK